MPVLLSERLITFEFADLARRRPVSRPAQPLARTPGVHQSGILTQIALKIGVLAPGEPLEEDMPMMIALGIMWEEFVFSMLEDAVWQPGELTVDGVSVNCDGISPFVEVPGSNSFGQIEEAKLTLKKVATGDEFIKDKKFWMWQQQGRSYCYCYGPRVERWHVLHLKGDYKKGDTGIVQPVYKEYTVGYSDSEVDQTWQMLMKHKHLAVPEGELAR